MGTIQKLSNYSPLQEQPLHMTVMFEVDYLLGMWFGQAARLPFPGAHT